MTSKLKLKRKKFNKPYKEDINDADRIGCISIETTRNEIKLLKNHRIFERAISNAEKHGIKLKPGTENKGSGNCSYESVILNINDRDCFEEKLPMTHEFYRRIWNTDLMNKILDGRIPWNPGLTRSQIQEGFQELMEAGVYERRFFGDMMMAGIACGTRKIILIFNTHELTPHDPISVVDPCHYGGICDTDIPVVLAYDLVHFESLHPIELQDIEETVKLTKSYTANPSRYMQDYGFTRNDMKYLVSESAKNCVQECNSRTIQIEEYSDGKVISTSKMPQEHQETKLRSEHQSESSGQKREDTSYTSRQQQEPRASQQQQRTSSERKQQEKKSSTAKEQQERSSISKKQPGTSTNKEQPETLSTRKQKLSNSNLTTESYAFETKNSEDGNCFKFLNLDFQEMKNGKIKCAICQAECVRLVTHLNYSTKCSQYINLEKLKIEFSKYRNIQRQKKYVDRQKNSDLEEFTQKVNERKRKQEERQKADDPDEFRKKVTERKKNQEARQRVKDPEGFKNNVNEKKRKQEEKQRAKDPEGFKSKVNERKRKHGEMQKEKDPEGFINNVNEQKRKQEEKQRAKDPEGFKNKVNEKKRKQRKRQKEIDPEGFRNNVNEQKRKQEDKSREKDPEGFKNHVNEKKRKQEEKQRAKDPEGFKNKVNEKKRKQEERQSAGQRLSKFRRRVQYGPIFICSCCHQKLFINQVEEYSEIIQQEIDAADPNIRAKCIEEEVPINLGKNVKIAYLCKSCKKSLKGGRMPRLCTKNGLEIDRLDPDLILTELENNLIATNIIFQKIHKLPKSRWSGTHDRLVNVPVGPQDVLNTIESLPRTPSEAGIIPIIPVKLKRKLEYKSTHLVQMIDTNKIYKYLDYLCKMGHPSYKFYDDWNTYKRRCVLDDPVGAKIIFPEAESEIVDLEVYLSELKETQVTGINSGSNGKDLDDMIIEAEEKLEEDYVRLDPVRKYQYDYNKTTCMTNKFPEADYQSALSFAPAEGKIPTSILKDQDWDINSFPNLHPSGRNKMFQDREVKVTPQQYLIQRLKNKDPRFEQCTPYVFAATAYIEEKQMERNIGISFNKGKRSDSGEGPKSYELEDAYSVLDKVKGTPKYWKTAKMEMLAKIDNFGPFHWFYTLSCADMRWDVNFSTILHEKGYKIIWICRKDEYNESEENKNNEESSDDVKVKVEFLHDGNMMTEDLNVFLEKYCDISLHESIRTNVLTATRNFVQRIKAFRTEIMMGKGSPLKIKYWSDKMEFQGRGAGHIHGVAWSDLKKISQMIDEEKKAGIILSRSHDHTKNTEMTSEISNLEKAYRSLKDNKALTEAEEKALIDFVDRSVTCTLNPELAAKMIDTSKNKQFGMKIIEIVKACMIHHHTKACRKCGSIIKCRFRFPRFPIWETILTSKEKYEGSSDEKELKQKKHKEVLDSVLNVLEDEESVENIMKVYNKEDESISEYRVNRKERILKILDLADVSPEDYTHALKEGTRNGVNVILARDIDELYVNNYNPEWLLAWDGNIDLSPVFDFFAVTTYVTEYFTKDESGTTKFLADASKQIKDLPVKDQKRCIKNVFLTHRQMGISEAYMKIFPDMNLKDSNIASEFIHLGRKEDMSRYLCRADPEQNYMDYIELFEVKDREGLYWEKPNWIDKYLRRDLSEWEELSLPQYVKMFSPTNQGGNKDEDTDDDSEDEDLKQENNKIKFEKDEIKYGQEVKWHYLITRTGELGKPLPKFMEISNPYPGEPRFLRKRRHPKSLRFFKVKRDREPERFFLHELMMYKSFNSADYERWHDPQKAMGDYEKYKDMIKNVKKQVMEWIEDVEEARYFVEEIMKNEVDVEEIGEHMDPEMQKEDIECENLGFEEDDQYNHLDPDGMQDQNLPNVNNWCRNLVLLDENTLEKETQKLDAWQRKVLDSCLKYVRRLRKVSSGFGNLQVPDNLVVIGGAGSGKTTIIQCLTQWAHRILAKSGDDPNSPYIIRAATTGAASVLIEGTTVHSSLGFDFQSKHTSLSDKKREQKREQLKNLKILIIDEFSMLKADMLYRIHLRLMEITQINQNFGGVNVYLFGDPAQLKPVKGSYVFAAPNHPDYKLTYGDGSDSLWRSFKVINLEENHRQGKDKVYADMLNRIRMDKHTEEDIEILKSRVRKKGHKDLKDAMYIGGKCEPVRRYNEKAISILSGNLYINSATHIQALSKSFRPRLDKVGRIGETQFVDKLFLKIGARVMLIFNIDVADLLCNGATGTVLGIEEGKNDNILAVIVKFDHPEAGAEARKRNPMMSNKYPNGTVIKKKEFDYPLGKSNGMLSATAKLVQFPLVLAWGVTVNKFQGSTVKCPQRVLVDLKTVWDQAQAYVMFSRVQKLEQLYILDEIPPNCIRQNPAALEEIERLISVSMNSNPSDWDDGNTSKFRVSFLNCRSMKNKFENIKKDRSILKSDLIMLTETWLDDDDQNLENYYLPHHTAYFNNGGRGKGIAAYCNNKFTHKMSVKEEGFSILMLQSEEFDVIGVYRSQNGNINFLIEKLEALIDETKTCVIGGDMNICILSSPDNFMTRQLRDKGFLQLVNNATHIDGGLIDHVYFQTLEQCKYTWRIEDFPKYYSDHDSIGLTLWKLEKDPEYAS